jgi:hypothetical protein
MKIERASLRDASDKSMRIIACLILRAVDVLSCFETPSFIFV